MSLSQSLNGIPGNAGILPANAGETPALPVAKILCFAGLPIIQIGALPIYGYILPGFHRKRIAQLNGIDAPASELIV